MGLPSRAIGGIEAVKKWGLVAMHAAIAAAFMFLLQRFALHAIAGNQSALGADLRRLRRRACLQAGQSLIGKP